MLQGISVTTGKIYIYIYLYFFRGAKPQLEAFVEAFGHYPASGWRGAVEMGPGIPKFAPLKGEADSELLQFVTVKRRPGFEALHATEDPRTQTGCRFFEGYPPSTPCWGCFFLQRGTPTCHVSVGRPGCFLPHKGAQRAKGTICVARRYNQGPNKATFGGCL